MKIMNKINNELHIMFDLETLSNATRPIIMSLSYVFFNPNLDKQPQKLIDMKITTFLDINSQLDAGGDFDQNTMFWWFKQNTKAQMEFVNKGRCAMDFALNDLNTTIQTYIEDNDIDISDVYVWSKGTEYDISKILAWMEYYKIQPIWKYNSALSVRNVDFGRQLLNHPIIQKETSHLSIEDVNAQIEDVCEYYKYLRFLDGHVIKI